MNQFASIFVLAVVVLLAAWYTIDRIYTTTQPGTPREYEASAYGPMRANNARHLRHECRGCRWQMVATPGALCTVCTDWHDTREQEPFDQELADLDKIERYANGSDAA